MDKLLVCYEKMKEKIGSEIEPYNSVELVEKYRQFWKPKNVKVILLAESHVFTSDAERKIELKNLSELTNYPLTYARFVYCLAYGESELLRQNTNMRNSGTPQFWKIFYSCANQVTTNTCFNSVKKSTTDTTSRINNKINLLFALKELGVWLIDTSVVALYDKGNKPDSKTMSNSIKTSWENYTRNVVIESDPRHVIVIGKGVANHIESDLKNIMGANNYTIIAQPNAHLSAEEHMSNFQTYYRLCNF